ncbi:unnamed protein product [Prorocentrum cordatum]|uniref:Secreted protein n=1 Tax=Prorocentrum cordatum TaxID=2364126 RepID=A0ABN9T1M5_9DINO|nr:unnamed protein product [Polarella glacialis]
MKVGIMIKSTSVAAAAGMAATPPEPTLTPIPRYVTPAFMIPFMAWLPSRRKYALPRIMKSSTEAKKLPTKPARAPHTAFSLLPTPFAFCLLLSHQCHGQTMVWSYSFPLNLQRGLEQKQKRKPQQPASSSQHGITV